MRHLLDTTEFNKSELEALIALGREMKANPAAFRTGLAGKNIVTLFEKQSLRTRVTFDIGINRLGGHA
ncbi:MAG: ornithine carbamoyltransferase, partial [Tolumonas sp.]